jgi:putative ABC transport system permease protein
MRCLRRFLARLANFATRRQDDQRFAGRDGGASRAADGGQSSRRHVAGGGAPPGSPEVGAVEALREGYHAEQGLPFIESLLQDLRYATLVLAWPREGVFFAGFANPEENIR